MSKVKTISAEDLVSKVEKILDKEIESIPEILDLVVPEKRLEFIKGLLPLVIKYRDEHKPDPWS